MSKVIMTVHGFISEDKKELDKYKKEHSHEWLQILGATTFDVVEEEDTSSAADIFDPNED
jgi:hypothetical protein